jgi:hypothetical protein
MRRRAFPVTCLAVSLLASGALSPGAEPPGTHGWRGNWTGLYPEATAPEKWGRIANGPLAGMTCQSARPPEGGQQSGKPVEGGLVRDWLVIGPFGVGTVVEGAITVAGPQNPVYYVKDDCPGACFGHLRRRGQRHHNDQQVPGVRVRVPDGRRLVQGERPLHSRRGTIDEVRPGRG